MEVKIHRIRFKELTQGSFSNDDDNGKENVTWKETLAQLWLFCD